MKLSLTWAPTALAQATRAVWVQGALFCLLSASPVLFDHQDTGPDYFLSEPSACCRGEAAVRGLRVAQKFPGRVEASSS